MSNKVIRSAIESRLSAWAAAQSPALRVAWQKVPFTPVVGEKHLRGYLLPAETDDLTLGADVKTFSGIYQVSVCAPDGSGPAAAETLGEQIIALFPANLQLVKSGITTVIVRTPSMGPIQDEPGIIVIPISIRYRADKADQ